MPRKLQGIILLVVCSQLVGFCGCANYRWGFPWGQGTAERQRARAVVSDPYPLNDIAPEVVGGRPREFMSPQHEARREQLVEKFPKGFFSNR